MEDDFGGELHVPIRRSDDLMVKVRVDELPEDAIDVIDILKAELAPLEIWFNIAMAYYRQGKEDQFLAILMEGSDPGLEVVHEYKDKKKEKITILNTLAFYYILLATKEVDPKKKEGHWSKVVDFFTRGQKIDIRNNITWLGRGMLQLLKSQYDSASKSFDTALEGDICIPALIGKGLILANQENYSNAIRYFRKAISSNPGCPEEVRFALGVCFYKQNKVQASKQCFERVLEMDPNNVEALISMAVLELNSDSSKDKKKSIQNAFQYIKRAYDANPKHPRVLNFLAEHFFFAEDYEPVLKLASASYHSTEIKEIKAESKYQMGRYYHSQNKYQEAFECYVEAVKLWPQYSLAHYGLGQLYIWKKEYTHAINSFEKVIAQYPNNFDALYVLGSLYIKTNKEKKAVDYLQRAVENNPHDLPSKLLLAQLIQNEKHDKALKLYTDAIIILKNTKEKIPIEVWNNSGVLHYLLALPVTDYFSRIDYFSKAKQCFTNILVGEGSENIDIENINYEQISNVSIAFNLARVYEEENDFNKATKLYEKILSVHPAYFDAQIRLAVIALKKSDTKEAEQIIKDVLSKSPKSITAMMMLGKIYSVKREYHLAQKEYEKILTLDPKDSYSKLSLGNIYYMATYDNKKKEEKKFLKWSNDFYWKVWKEEPNNIYAASGIGMILAEKDKLAAAQLIFTQVREGSTDMPDAWINLANTFMAQSNFPKAIKLYEICSTKFYNSNNLKVLLYLSKAYFESNRFAECESTLNRLIHLNPTDLTLWYNLALTKEASAALALKSKEPTKQSVESSVSTLEQAKKLFVYLQELAEKDSKKKYSSTKVKNHIDSCTKRIEKSKVKLELALNLEKQKQIKQEQMQKEIEKIRQRKEIEEQEKRLQKEKQQEEERKILEELEREREEFMQKFRESEKKQASSGKSSKKSGKSKKSKKDEEDIYEDDKERPNVNLDPEDEQSWEKDREKKKERAMKKLQNEGKKKSTPKKSDKKTTPKKKGTTEGKKKKTTENKKTKKTPEKKGTEGKKKKAKKQQEEDDFEDDDDGGVVADVVLEGGDDIVLDEDEFGDFDSPNKKRKSRESSPSSNKKLKRKSDKEEARDEVEIFDDGGDSPANDDLIMGDDDL